MIQQPIKIHGGKHYLAEWIISQFPLHTSYSHFVETYFGGGSVLLRMPRGRSEYVNDINENLTSFWRMLQSRGQDFERFKHLVEQTPFSEVEYERAELILENTDSPMLDPVMRAWAFFIVSRQSRQGLCKVFAPMSRNRTRRDVNEQASLWLSAVDGLSDVRERLRGVVITCKPALEVIQQQDGARTLFYIDPPYLPETRSSTNDYQHEMTEADHEALLLALGNIKGRFVLSGYPSLLYTEVASAFRWKMVSCEIDNKASSKAEKTKKTECLWMNY